MPASQHFIADELDQKPAGWGRSISKKRRDKEKNMCIRHGDHLSPRWPNVPVQTAGSRGLRLTSTPRRAVAHYGVLKQRKQQYQSRNQRPSPVWTPSSCTIMGKHTRPLRVSFILYSEHQSQRSLQALLAPHWETATHPKWGYGFLFCMPCTSQ